MKANNNIYQEANARINQLMNVKPSNKQNTMKTTINKTAEIHRFGANWGLRLFEDGIYLETVYYSYKPTLKLHAKKLGYVVIN